MRACVDAVWATERRRRSTLTLTPILWQDADPAALADTRAPSISATTGDRQSRGGLSHCDWEVNCPDPATSLSA
jgi:hypothetical protein